jgi:hypothetical protein
MAETLTDFEKQLIHAAFYKHVNMSPRDMEKVVGIDPAMEELAPAEATGKDAAASTGRPANAEPDASVNAPADATGQDAAPATPAAPDIVAPDIAATDPIQDLELLTEDQWIGRHLIRVKRAKKEFLVDADYIQMRNAVNYIRRHADRPPKTEDKMEEWRYGLRARGFDPDKAQSPPHTDATASN